MKRAALALLLVAACKPKPAPVVVVDAGVVAIVDAGVVVDAAPEAAAPVAIEEEAPAELTFSLVATFSPAVRLTHGIRLTDGIAVSQTNDHGWDIYTASKSAPIANLTSKIKQRIGDPFWIWGSAAEIWATTGGANGSVHATRTDGSKTKMYRFAVPFRGTQWLGVPSGYPPFYLSDDRPNTFEQLEPADASADVPIIPKTVQLWTLAALGDGKLCGVGVHDGGDAGPRPYRLWWWASPTNTKVIDLANNEAVGGGNMKAFRGPNDKCTYAFPKNDESTGEIDVRQLMGNQVVPLAAGIPHGSFDVTNSGNVFWVTQDKAHVIRRIDLAKNPVLTKKYPLPANVEGCTLGDVDGIAAIADDDIWLVAHCAQDHDVLLHTQPAGTLVVKVPPP